MTITVERSTAAALRLMAKQRGGDGTLEALADQLDPIDFYSTSYPFLALARLIDAKYGDVLWFVDYLTSKTVSSSQHYRDALDRLGHSQREAILHRLHRMRQDARAEDER